MIDRPNSVSLPGPRDPAALISIIGGLPGGVNAAK